MSWRHRRGIASLEQVIHSVGARRTLGVESWPSGIVFHDVSTDSRSLGRYCLFFALKGERFDGHDFVMQAAQNGAWGAVVEREDVEAPEHFPLIVVPDAQQALGDLARFYRRRCGVPVVAVTGSYGKTTTRALISAALGAKFDTLATEGNFNNEIGLPLTLFRLEFKHQIAVLELGMRGRGQIEYLARIAEPTVGVITNVGPQHLELLGSETEIARAKAELLQSLPADGLAVLPADSSHLELLRNACSCRVVTFGSAENADYRVEFAQTATDGTLRAILSVPKSLQSDNSSKKERLSARKPDEATQRTDISDEEQISSREKEIFRANIGHGGLSPIKTCDDSSHGRLSPIMFIAAEAHGGDNSAHGGLMEGHGDAIEAPGRVVEVRLPLPGLHNAVNAAAALAVACELGVALGEAARALETAQVPGARMRLITHGGFTVIDDCYNAGPDSLRAALQTLREIPAARRVAVLGAMKELGPHSEAFHRELGALAGEICDVIWGVGEEARALLDAARGVKTVWFPDARSAASHAGDLAREDDAILVKGSRSVGLEVVVAALGASSGAG